jgi:hypothetical protein
MFEIEDDETLRAIASTGLWFCPLWSFLIDRKLRETEVLDSSCCIVWNSQLLFPTSTIVVLT